MSYPNYGRRISGVKYPVFDQPLGVADDERFYSVDANQWLKGRTIGSLEVVSEDTNKLKIDAVGHDEGVITFRAKDGVQGFGVVKITIPVAGAVIVRRYCIQVLPL